jgi:large subunit ribosomal protein L29
LPIIRLNELRGLTPEQKTQKLIELKTELSKLNTLIAAGGSIEKPGRARALKKAIAKIETVINEEALRQ